MFYGALKQEIERQQTITEETSDFLATFPYKN